MSLKDQSGVSSGRFHDLADNRGNSILCEICWGVVWLIWLGNVEGWRCSIRVMKISANMPKATKAASKKGGLVPCFVFMSSSQLIRASLFFLSFTLATGAHHQSVQIYNFFSFSFYVTDKWCARLSIIWDIVTFVERLIFIFILKPSSKKMYVGNRDNLQGVFIGVEIRIREEGLRVSFLNALEIRWW